MEVGIDIGSLCVIRHRSKKERITNNVLGALDEGVLVCISIVMVR